MSKNLYFEKYSAPVRLQGGLLTKLPVTLSGTAATLAVGGTLSVTGNVTQGGVATGTPATLASAATVAFTPTTVVTTHTPSQGETINFSTPGAAGTQIHLEVVTSGTSSYTLTFGTNTKTTGTLATGTSDAKTFVVSFVSDGTNWVEFARTTAM